MSHSHVWWQQRGPVAMRNIRESYLVSQFMANRLAATPRPCFSLHFRWELLPTTSKRKNSLLMIFLSRLLSKVIVKTSYMAVTNVINWMCLGEETFSQLWNIFGVWWWKLWLCKSLQEEENTSDFLLPLGCFWGLLQILYLGLHECDPILLFRRDLSVFPPFSLKSEVGELQRLQILWGQ